MAVELEVRRDDPGLPRPNECAVVRSAALPPTPLETASFVWAFANRRMLLTRLAARGLDNPGGPPRAG